MKFHCISLKDRIKYLIVDVLERLSILFCFFMVFVIACVFLPIRLLSFDADCVFRLQKKLINYFLSKLLSIIYFDKYKF
ncbi:MAG: hypothetical protein K0R72_1204 [Clostridia bacterium]|jgi:hypothetical protein|nr:hypothetical protein [Clostridia bacterium]